MNEQPDNFEALRKLLALKRYEQPPPRFFQDFSTHVIHRLDRLDTCESLPWWQKLGLDFDFKPAYACGLGIMFCGLLSIGIMATASGVKAPALANLAEPAPYPSPASPILFPVAASPAPALTAPETIPGSTEPVLVNSDSPFDQLRPKAIQVSYSYGMSGN